MTVAIVVLALVIGALVANAIVDRVALRNRADAYIASRDQLALKTVEADRLTFELAAEKKARKDADARATAMEAYVAEIEESPNADLDPSDVASRIRRVLLARAAEAANTTGDPVRPDGEPAVRDDIPAEELHEPGPDDLLRPE